MKPLTLLVIAAMLFVTLACSFSVNLPEIKTGQTQVFTVNEPAVKTATNIDLSMGAGTLSVTGGSTGLLEGSVTYNVEQWKPSISRSGQGITLTQGPSDQFSANLPANNVKNDWVLKLGSSPIDLTIKAGAYEGSIDLSGVAVTNLSISDGAAKNQVQFNTPNPAEMQTFDYKTGASEVKLYGLANANFSQMTFESGAGNYTLDFGGKLTRDENVTINSGVSNFKIIIPKGMNCQVTMKGALSNITPTGTWTIEGGTYKTQGEGPLVKITVQMGVGNLELVNQ
jgi:hypothetical protein